MLKQDVPLRTGWFGYRKLDVENCIAHIRAAYAAELRLARQTQQGMEETMAQLRQENKALSGSAGAGPDAGTARRSCGLLCKTGRTACGAAGTRVAAGNGAGEAFGGAAAPV